MSGVRAVSVGGYIYTFGGDNPSSAYRYDPQADSWTPRAGPPSIGPRPGVVTDGVDIYILTGFSGAPPASTLYRYDPASDSYIVLASPPHATGEHGLVYLDGKIYRISGHDSLNPTPTVDVYTIASGTWRPPAQWPITRRPFMSRSRSRPAAISTQVVVAAWAIQCRPRRTATTRRPTAGTMPRSPICPLDEPTLRAPC